MLNKTLRRLPLILIILVAIAVGVIHGLDHMMSYNDEELITRYTEKDTSVKVIYHEYEETTIRVVEEATEQGDSLLIVFVHGAPGDNTAFQYYMEDPKMRALGKLVTYDRPGYGKSSPEPMNSINDQADVLHSLVKSYDIPNTLIIGHSYGGPIVGNAIARYPLTMDKAIMIAPLNDPYNEPIFWFSYLAKWKTTKWLLPRSMKRAGDEKFSHAEELEKMEHLWATIQNPIMHIHGTNDVLAPAVPNLKWSRDHIPSSIIRIEEIDNEGHLIIWQGYSKVRDLILSMIKLSF